MKKKEEEDRNEKHTKRLKRKRAIHKHLKDKQNKLRVLSSMQGVGKKFMANIVKKKSTKSSKSKKQKDENADKEGGQGREYRSGKFFAKLQELAKDDATAGKRKKRSALPTPESALVPTRKYKL